MTAISPYRSPRTLLKELGITEPEDLKIEAIAEYCNATIIYEPLKGSEARILGYGDKAIITINSKSLRERQRFSAGHELGHWLQDRGKVSSFACTEKAFLNEWNRDNPERRANRYAVELLLPDFMVEPCSKNRDMTFKTVRSLATTFKMSLTATAIRLVELGSFPAILVFSEAGKRRWFVRGPDVPEAIWPKESPNAYTVAFELHRGGNEEEGPTDIQADGWIDHPQSKWYSLREDSIKIGHSYVLSLLWWKDERQLLDLEEDE
jgi:Zn-dependent peptidase ImmA (M78 family)